MPAMGPLPAFCIGFGVLGASGIRCEFPGRARIQPIESARTQTLEVGIARGPQLREVRDGVEVEARREHPGRHPVASRVRERAFENGLGAERLVEQTGRGRAIGMLSISGR